MMLRNRMTTIVPRAHSRWVAPIAVLLLGLGTAACDSILEVDLPGDVALEDLNSPALATTLVNGAQNDFECAFAVYIMNYALWTEELWDSSTLGSQRAWQLRQPQSDGGGDCPDVRFRGAGQSTPYGKLHIARVQAETAARLIQGFNVPGKPELLAKAALYQGYATTLLGEAYCEGRLGPQKPLISPDQVLEAAEALFASAMSGGSADITNAARVGRARALARLGRAGEAKTYAAAVPQGFRYDATYGGTVRRANWVHVYNVEHLFLSVAASYRNLDVDGVPDSRVPSTLRDDLSPNDGITTIWFQDLYPGDDSPIPIATWQEAQLIIAEAELDAGNTGAATDAINAVRDMYSLPAYAGGTVAEMRDLLLEERRRTLWLQSHRIGDMLQYGVAFPTGEDHKGRAYANETCQELPFSEL